jgi:hypothetical protein
VAVTGAGGSDRVTDVLRRAAATRRRDDGRPAFVDGLLLGALVGAAIAGSTLWSRWRNGRARQSSASRDGTPGST